MTHRTSPNFAAAFARLAAAERGLGRKTFVAPVIRGEAVGVRVGGVRCALEAGPAGAWGFAVLRAVAATRAAVVGPATVEQRRAYLDRLPSVRVILCEAVRPGVRGPWAWTGVPAGEADARLAPGPMVCVDLVLPGQAGLFDTVIARADGRWFWFDGAEPPGDDAWAAGYLRDALARNVAPGDLDRTGLTPARRAAYAAVYRARVAAARGRDGKRFSVTAVGNGRNSSRPK